MQVERDDYVEWRPGEYKVRLTPSEPGRLRSEKIPAQIDRSDEADRQD